VAATCAAPPASAKAQNFAVSCGKAAPVAASVTAAASAAKGAPNRKREKVAPPTDSPAPFNRFCSMKRSVCTAAAASVIGIQSVMRYFRGIICGCGTGSFARQKCLRNTSA